LVGGGRTEQRVWSGRARLPWRGVRSSLAMRKRSARGGGGTASLRENCARARTALQVLRGARKMGHFGIDRHPRPKNSARCVAPRVRNTRQTQRLARRGTTKVGVFSRPRKKEKNFGLANGRSHCTRAHESNGSDRPGVTPPADAVRRSPAWHQARIAPASPAQARP
jgi:hypothetical protein